eukprot:356023_1
MSDLGALLNPNTSPNIHYLSPANSAKAHPSNKNGFTAIELNGINEEDAYDPETNSDLEIQDDLEDDSDDDNFTSDTFHMDDPLNTMPTRLTAAIVGTPPNSTRQPANAPKARFNFKRLSQKLSDINIIPCIADVDKQSDIEEEETQESDVPITPDLASFSDDIFDAKQSHMEHLNKIIESLQFLEKQLPNLVEFEMNEASSVIRIKIPNVKQYENWDLNEIMFWIKRLENGRYKKYEQQLMNGFLEADITADYLP